MGEPEYIAFAGQLGLEPRTYPLIPQSGQLGLEPRTYPLIPQSGRAGFEPAILRLTAGRITIMLSTKLRDTTPRMTTLRLSTGLIRLDSYFVFVNTSLDCATGQSLMIIL